MSNRILLDNGGLKISKPGIDVLTATDDELVFNSDWSQLAIYMRGTLTVPDNGSTTISYGKTFVNMPLVCLLRTDNTTPGLPGVVCINDQAFWQKEDAETGYWDPTVQCNASNFIVTRQGTAGTMTFSYVVWDFDL